MKRRFICNTRFGGRYGADDLVHMNGTEGGRAVEFKDSNVAMIFFILTYFFGDK